MGTFLITFPCYIFAELPNVPAGGVIQSFAGCKLFSGDVDGERATPMFSDKHLAEMFGLSNRVPASMVVLAVEDQGQLSRLSEHLEKSSERPLVVRFDPNDKFLGFRVTLEELSGK